MSFLTNSSSSSEAGRPDAKRAAGEDLHAFGHLLDVRVGVSVILGTGTISVRECLALGPRSLVRLQQSAGEDLQVYAGDVPLARAEVVIVEESTGVRLTEILKPASSEER